MPLSSLFTSIKYYARWSDLKIQKIPCHLWRIKTFFSYLHSSHRYWILTVFTANLEIREISELSANLKMGSFLLKNQRIIREFWLNIRKIRKNWHFPTKIFFSGKFSFRFIFGYTHFHILKHYSYSFLLWVLCCIQGCCFFKIFWVFKYNMLDCCMIHHSFTDY